MGSKDFFHILTSEYERPCPKDMPGTPNSIFTKTNRVAVWASPHELCFETPQKYIESHNYNTKLSFKDPMITNNVPMSWSYVGELQKPKYK